MKNNTGAKQNAQRKIQCPASRKQMQNTEKHGRNMASEKTLACISKHKKHRLKSRESNSKRKAIANQTNVDKVRLNMSRSSLNVLQPAVLG